MVKTVRDRGVLNGMNRRDWILAVVLLLTAAVGMLAVHFAGTDGGSEVRITVGGEVYGTWPLSKDRTIEVNTSYGHNVVVIADGEVFMQDADCPDRYCIRQGAIKSTNKSIICLPHKLVVEVTGEAADTAGETLQPDSISK